jgi:subtilisin family serine protease
MKKLLVAILLGATLSAGIVLAQPYENSSVVGQVQDRVLITVKEGTTMALDKSAGQVQVGVPSLDALSLRFDVKDMEQIHAGLTSNFKDKAAASYFDRIWAVDFSKNYELKDVQAAYAALPEVEEVQLVDICKMYDAYLPNDISASQYYLRNMTPGGADIRAVGGWNQALGDSNIIVAVIDSGVDWHHPDLGGTHPDKVNGAIWTNWAEYYGTPGQDDDNNGKIDDIRGWDFVNLSASEGWPDEDVVGQDNDPMDYESHGTNCSGCVAAITNNGVGIAGTAPGCKIMAVRVGWLPNLSEQGLVRMDFAASGILYATNNGARIINASWGSSTSLAASVSAAINEGVLIVTAAGNDNDEVASYLGTRFGVLSVAATDQNDVKASFSSYGSWVELSAPGVAIYTTAYNRFTGQSTYASVQGTSFSSPIVAGAAALIWSANPDLTLSEMRNLITSTCDDISDVNPGYPDQLGAGRVNLLAALGDAVHQYPDEFPTMYDAMNSARAGDTVAVKGGTAIDGPLLIIGNKDYDILAGYNADYTDRDPINNKAVINGSPVDAALKFNGSVSPGLVVDGFEVTGGGGLVFAGIPYFAECGGGVVLNQVSPTLRNFEIHGNSVGSASQLGCGGGMMMTNSSAVLENVMIHSNTGIYGAGLYAYSSSPTLIDCVIENNIPSAANGTYPPRGGGVFVVDSSITLENTTISGHQDLDTGGGMYVIEDDGSSAVTMTGGAITDNSAKVSGGGLHMVGGTAQLTSVDFANNTKTATSTFMNGGGFYFKNATVSLDSLVCSGNDANAGGGGAIDTCPGASLTNSVFDSNVGMFYGGALAFSNTPGGTISGNTMVQNVGTLSGGAGLYLSASTPDITNNLVAFNTGGTGTANGMALTSAPSSLSCNNVFDNVGANYSGQADPTGTNGNISEDPLFCNLGEGNFNLSSESPCLPANSGGCGLIGALPGGCGASPVPDTNPLVPTVFRVEQNYPNPFNPKTTISFSLPEAGRAQVVIYDLKGRRVRTLVDDVLPAQTHQVSWTGDDDKGHSVAAGVYFYKVTSGLHQGVGRMALVK